MARTTKFTTTTGAVVATLLPSASVFLGIAAASKEAAGGLNVKLYWERTGVAPGSGISTPVAGTTVPDLTISVPTTGLLQFAPCPINNGGRIWYWVSEAPGDADTTALATGGDVITLIYD